MISNNHFSRMLSGCLQRLSVAIGSLLLVVPLACGGGDNTAVNAADAPAVSGAAGGATADKSGTAAGGVVTGGTDTTLAVVPPTIMTQPGDASVTSGQTATFKVVASGTPPLSYEWKKGTSVLGDANSSSSSYTTPATNTSDNGSTFSVVVSNSAGSVTSNAATLTVTSPVKSLGIVPDATILPVGGYFTFTATASVADGASTAVTWSVLEADGGSVDSSGQYIAPIKDGDYHVVATSVADTAKTATAVVHVSATMIIPPERVTVWSPGLNSVGGIPPYTKVFATLSPSTSGDSDTAAIQGALDAAGLVATASSPRVVYLTAGIYKITAGPIKVPSYVVLRGAGPDSTKLVRDFKGTGVDRKVKIVTGGLGGSQSGTNVATFVFSVNGGSTYTSSPQLITYYKGWDLGTTPAMRITFATGDGVNDGVVYTAGDIFTIHWDSSILPFGDWSISHTGTGFDGLSIDHNGDPYGLISVGGGPWADMGSGVALSTDAAKDATSVAVSSAAGFAAGDLVHIDEINEIAVGRVWMSGDGPNTWFSNLNRNVSQRMEIDHIVGNTIYFTTPFHTYFRVSHTAQIYKVNNVVRYAGVEDIYAYGGMSGDGGGNFYITNAMYCWVKHVESERSGGAGAGFAGTFRSEIRDSYIHTAAKIYPASSEYMLCVDSGASDNLVENNIAWDCGKASVMRSSGGGNVFGYNYMDDVFISDPVFTNFIESGVDSSHQVGPHFELFEGNQSFNFDSDMTHGNAFDIVAFRNHFTGLRRSASRPLPSFGAVTSVDNHDGHGPRAISLDDTFPRAAVRPGAHNYNFSFVANVLGFSGMPLSIVGTGTQQTTIFYDMEKNDIQNQNLGMWMLGNGGGGNWQAAPDMDVINSTLRDANFDYFTNQQRWHGIGRGHAPYSAPEHYILPNSFYLKRAPSFFGSNPWPWVTPEGATKIQTLPARARFEAGTPNTVD